MWCIYLIYVTYGMQIAIAVPDPRPNSQSASDTTPQNFGAKPPFQHYLPYIDGVGSTHGMDIDGYP